MGEEGVDYDEFKFDNLIEYQKKTIKYKAAVGLEKGKYKFYTSSQDKIMYINDEPMFKKTMLIMGRNGDTSVHYDNNFSCEHDHVYVMKIIKTDTRYIYYYIKSYIKWFSDQMNGSTIRGTSKEILSKFNIRILKPSIISKYKLDDDFEFMDKLRNDIQNTLKIQEEITKQMMTLILNTTTDHNIEDNDNFDDSTNDDIIIESKNKLIKETNDGIIVESKKKLTKINKINDDVIVKSKKKLTKNEK